MKVTDEMIEVLRSVNGATIFVLFLLVVMTFAFILKHRKDFCEMLNSWRAKKNYQETMENMVKDNCEKISQFEYKLDQVIHTIDRLQDTIVENDKVNRKEHEDFKEDARRRHLEDCKQSLYHAYRYYKNRAEQTGKMEWTNIEADGFWSLSSDYESCGGNGYFHKTIQPYMSQFIISEPDDLK